MFLYYPVASQCSVQMGDSEDIARKDGNISEKTMEWSMRASEK